MQWSATNGSEAFSTTIGGQRDRRPTFGTGRGALADFPESTPLARHLIEVGAEEYAPFVLGNARALEAGEKAFVIPTYGEDTSYLARPYPERSRRMICDRIEHRLTASERQQVESWLEANGLTCFLP